MEDKHQRKIVALVVSASAREENHKTLLKAGFYTLFKRNVNNE
jgi:hypothetical protein